MYKNNKKKKVRYYGLSVAVSFINVFCFIVPVLIKSTNFSHYVCVQYFILCAVIDYSLLSKLKQIKEAKIVRTS